MKSKTLYLLLFGVLGELIIFFVLHEFIDHMGTPIFVLNFIFASLAFLFLLLRLFNPLADTEDKEQKWVGSIGINLAASTCYLIGTGLAIYFCNAPTPVVPLKYQLLIHVALIAFLIISRFFSSTSHEKVGEIYRKEQATEDKLNELKLSVKRMLLNLSMYDGIPPEVKDRINSLDESLRYITPVLTEEAQDVENKMLDITQNLNISLKQYQVNKSFIDKSLDMFEELLKYRKTIHY